jgi:GR25 family glycosyltransferase involved in LPS biosynthesis
MSAHRRPVHLRQAIRSIREFYPDLELIIVADQEVTDTNRRIMAEDPYIKFHWLGLWDAGVSVMRNLGRDLNHKKYTLVLEDDFVFTKDTKIEHMREVLEHDQAAAVCCGALYYFGRLRWFANKINLDEKNKIYETIPIRKPEWRYAGSTKYFYAEYCFNFFMMKTDAGLRWDDELKIAIEHIDFFIRLKKAGKWKVAFTPEVSAIHNCTHPNKQYAADRTRYKYWERFYEKHGYRYGLNRAEQRVYDLVNRKPLPYPEFLFYLLKNMQGRSAAAPN